MALTPYQLLGYLPMMEPVQVKMKGLPRVLPDPFYNLTEQVSGDKATVIKFNGTRRVAQVRPYGAPPLQVERLDPGEESFKLLHSIETMPYDQHFLKVLREWDKYVPEQQWFKVQLAQYGENFAERQVNLRTAVTTSNLATGKTWFDADGNLLPNATGASLVVDQQVPAANQGGIGGILTTSWADPTADIAGNIRAVKKRARRGAGRPLKYAFYGANVTGYIERNASMSKFFQFNPVAYQSFVDNGKVPDGAFGLIWVAAQDAFYEDATGTERSLFPDDQITFTPEPSKDWYTVYEGSFNVPNKLGMFTNAQEAVNNWEERFGMFRYAYIEQGKVFTVHEVQGDTFLPRFKVPEAVFMLDTTP